MLESTYDSVDVGVCDDAAFQKALSVLPFDIQVPRALLEGYQGSGPTKTTMSEQRRYVRFLHLTRGILRYSQTFPSIGRSSGLHSVLITNVSKCGVGLLNGEQLFPSERMNLWMLGRGVFPVTIARCRKINERCYEIGAIIDL